MARFHLPQDARLVPFAHCPRCSAFVPVGILRLHIRKGPRGSADWCTENDAEETLS